MLQLEYFLGSVSMNLETFLGFLPVLRFSHGDTLLTFILDGRAQASIKYQPRNVSSYS